MERRLYFVGDEEKSAFFAMSQEEQHLYIFEANRAAYEREVEAQDIARQKSREEWQAKYGHLTDEQYLERMGHELKDVIERQREEQREEQRTLEHFNIGYSVPMGSVDTEARQRAETFIATIEQHQPQGEAPDTLKVEVIFEPGDKSVTINTSGVLHEFEMTRAGLPAIKTRLFVVPGGLAFQTTNERWIGLGVELDPALVEGLNARNARRGWKIPVELLARFESREPSIKPRFPSNEAIAMLPNSAADRDVHRSLMAYPYQWPIDENLCLRAFDGQENIVVYQPSEVEKLLRDAPQKALELLEKRFGEIKNETVPDVIDILFHHWHRHHDPKTNASLITAAQICKYRGVLPRGANLDLHWRALQDAFSMSLRERKGDINAKVFFSEIVGEKLGAGAGYAYSPGFMVQYALRGETLYFAPFMEKIWALDPKTNNEAKRIARYMRGDWRMNTEKYLTAESGAARAARYHTWTHILCESGIDVKSHRQSKNPKRLIEAINRAVETLYQMEVLDETGFDIYHRDDRKIAENLPARGALDAWLALRVCLAPAADVREALLETDGKRRAGKARDAKALSTERAKKALKANPKLSKR